MTTKAEALDLLQRAAQRLREHAAAATPGPWVHVDYQGSHHEDITYMGCGSVVTLGYPVIGGDIAAPSGDLYPRGGYSPFEDMAYIALVNPIVGLALADLLDLEIKILEPAVQEKPDAPVGEFGAAFARLTQALVSEDVYP